MNKDFMLRGTAHNDTFRWFAVTSTNTVQTARDLHDLSPIATLLMGRMISASAMLAWDLKDSLSEVTFRVDGDGALVGAVIICTAEGHIRGYAQNPRLFLPDVADNFQVGKALGKGTLNIMHSKKGRTSYSGTCELITGDIAEDLANYFLQSEQIPTAVNLGILIAPDATVRSSGGFIIQQLPFADQDIAEQINQNLNATPNVSDLMDMGLSLSEILNRFVFKGISWHTNEERELQYKCNCSRERFSRALLLLGKEELSTMQEGITPICHYCSKSYTFDPADMELLLSEASQNNK